MIRIVKDQRYAKSFYLLRGKAFDGSLCSNRHECGEERDTI